MLVAGSASECDALATQLADVEGVTAVLTAKGDGYSKGLPEIMSPLVVECQKAGNYSHILAGSNAFGKNLVPRVGALLDVQPIADIAEIKSEDTFVRLVYAGNAVSTVQSSDPVKLLTVSFTKFDRAPEGAGGSPTVSDAPAPSGDVPHSEWLNEALASGDRPELTSADVVVSGGRALKSGENFGLLYDLGASILCTAPPDAATQAADSAGALDNSMLRADCFAVCDSNQRTSSTRQLEPRAQRLMPAMFLTTCR